VVLRGRQLELDRATAAVAAAAAGDGASAVVVDGDAGMGKTALLDAVVRVAGAATTLRGRGHALGGGVAYGPVAGALARHLHRLEPDERARLVGGLGSLGLLVEGVGDAPPPGDPELDRARMFQAVALLISRLAVRGPVVLAVDDLHWADTASVELLVYLVGELRGEAVAFVVAARPGELGDRPGTRHLVAELLRLPHAARVAVGPLDPTTVTDLAADRLGGPVDPAFVAELVDRTGGVALAVDAVLGALLADGDLADGPAGWAATVPVAIPGYVVDLFAQRLDALAPTARAAVAAIAIADTPLDVAELAAVLDVAADATVEAAAAARSDGLLVELASGTWEVSHPLVGTAARDLLPVDARQGLHRALADLDRMQGEAALDDLARHVLAAGPALGDDRAVDVLARAGHRARTRGAGDVAAGWLLAAADRAAAAGRPAADLAALHGEAATALEHRGDLLGALAARTREADVLAGIDPGGDAQAAAAAGHLCWQLGSPVGDAWWDRAITAAREAGRVDQLRVHRSWLSSLMRQGRFEEARGAADRVRADLAVVGDDPRHRQERELTELRLLVFDCFGVGAPAEAVLEHDIELEADAPLATVAEVAGIHLDALVLLGRFDEARRRADDLLRRLGPDAGVTGLGWRPITARVLAHVAVGAWEDATDLLTEIADDTPVAVAARAVWNAVGAVRRGDVERAREIVAEARPHLGGAGMALRHKALDVVAAYADVVAGEEPSTDAALGPHDYFAMSHAVLAALAGEVLANTGRPSEARDVAAALRARGRPGSHPHALAARIEALATGDAVGLAAAATAFDGFGLPFDAAVARLEAAERDRGAITPSALARAAEVFERLGAAPWSARAQALGAARLRRGPAVPELTRREREVAELVAEGLTNGQVAERLGVSIRTVTSHLDHAYTKLGIGSRAALVAHLLRLPAAT